MATLFLLIIYMAFISLGLPDSLLGVSWPLMQKEFGVPLDAAGVVSMFIAGTTIVSSFSSGAVHKRLSAGQITFISCLMTAGALIGFYFSPSFVWLLIFSIPLGLGAGSVDAALNNYVATHYKAHHMSWLHSFWGVGATLGPIIMSWFIARQSSWRSGYFAISIIQLSLAALLFFTLPLWKRMAKEVHKDVPASEKETVKTSVKISPLKIKGVKLTMFAFLFYCGAEVTMGLWGSSYLVNIKGLSVEIAAQWVSLYYGGITAGRLVSGFITMKLSNKLLIRIGQSTSLVGVILLLLPLPNIFSLIGFILVGLGFAPTYPGMVHETPIRFGRENSQSVIGYQMALGYTGTTFLPPVFGFVAARTSIMLFPFFVLAYVVFVFLSCEKLNNLVRKQ